MSSVPNKFVPRVTQLDAKNLDDEINVLLDDALSKAFTYTCQNALVKYEPEWKALIHSFLYYNTVGKRKQTVGQELLQIKYEDSVPPQNINYHLAFHIFGSWLKQRTSLFTSVLKSEEHITSVVRLISAFEITYQVAEFFNLICFLLKGKYPTLTERLFKLNVISSNPESQQKVCYNYFTRELLWNGFADLLAFVLPLITVNKFHRFICQFLPSAVSFETNLAKQDFDTNQPFEVICIICDGHAILPQTFGCNHVACYYCIHSTLASTSSFLCSVCGNKIDNLTHIMPLPSRIKKE